MNRLYTVSSRWRQELQSLLNSTTHSSLFGELKQIKPLQQVHAQLIVSTPLLDNVFLCNSLLNAYASSGHILQSHILFSQILKQNVVSWTILVSGFAKDGLFMEAIGTFYEMVVVHEIRPNEMTIASVLPAFGKLGDTRMGKSLHCYWIKQKFEDNVYVETGLVGMYLKFRCFGIAKCLFDNMSVRRNVVSWNTIISGFSENGYGEEALRMFNGMRREGLRGDFFTIMGLVSGCLTLEDLSVGVGVHGLIIRSGYESDPLVKTSLMELYINGDFASDAYCIFSEMKNKDLVSWTLMLRGFVKSGKWERTVEHFSKMMGEDGLKIDSVSLTTILSGCSTSGSLQLGKRVHALVIKTGFEVDIFVGSSLIDMYANCASIGDAIRHFDWMEDKDVACWNALISCYGMMGYGIDAINLFLKMKHFGINPDESTYVSVLCACSHAGMVDQGLQIFDDMIETWNINPTTRHFACVIDLLGRAGRINDAYSLVKRMHSQPGLEVYGALLTACGIHKNYDLGFEISQKLFQLKPNDAGHYILLSNMYALAGNWAGVKSTRMFLKSSNLKKDPGFSSVEINGEIFTFMASQKDHPYYPEIKEFLRSLISKIEAEGYEPDMNSVFQDVSDDVKRDILLHHSEKLAIAFGLMRIKPETNVIRITKNLRICNDCHSACKFISQVYSKMLVIKDSNRFHVFQAGMCSCGDYW